MGVLGEVFVLKSGLRIFIWAPEVLFSVPPKKPKTPKMTQINKMAKNHFSGVKMVPKVSKWGFWGGGICIEKWS